MVRNPKLQRVALSMLHLPMHCPFCGRKVIPVLDGASAITPCPHTLFVASEEGFEFRSARFDAKMGLTEDADLDFVAIGVDGFTDRLEIRGGIKFVLAAPPPCGVDAYLGFAPLEVVP